MAGFNQVVPNVIPTFIEGGLTLPLAPLPLYALLKLVAFSDRKEPKDLGGVLHCLERYGVDYDGQGVPYEYTCAHLLGFDAKRFLDEPLSQAVKSVLELFDEADAEVVGIVAGEAGRLMVNDDRRTEIFWLYRWFRLGGGL